MEPVTLTSAHNKFTLHDRAPAPRTAVETAPARPGERESVMPHASTLQDLSDRLREFARQRDWGRFHSPKNLAMALVAEAGELAAEFQWLTEAQSAELADPRHP